MKRVILTGFEPYAHHKFNPVEASTKYFDGMRIGEYEVKGIVLPTTYFSSFDVLKDAINEIKPIAVVSSGLATSALGIRLELRGLNNMNGPYPDANGYAPKNIPLKEGGSESLMMLANNVHLALKLSEADIPAVTGYGTDTFVCNALRYQTTDYITEQNLSVKNVFFHTPWTKDYAGRVPLEQGKIMLPKDALYDGIDTIIRHIEE